MRPGPLGPQELYSVALSSAGDDANDDIDLSTRMADPQTTPAKEKH